MANDAIRPTLLVACKIVGGEAFFQPSAVLAICPDKSNIKYSKVMLAGGSTITSTDSASELASRANHALINPVQK